MQAHAVVTWLGLKLSDPMVTQRVAPNPFVIAATPLAELFQPLCAGLVPPTQLDEPWRSLAAAHLVPCGPLPLRLRPTTARERDPGSKHRDYS